jgi:radical SAM protein with 4Fe4S-binding SPASM domain
MVHLNSLVDVGRYAKYLQMLERACDKRSKEVGVGEVLWLITGRCDLKCDYCYLGDTYRNFELPEKDITWIARLLGELSVPVVFISGGEPLLYKKLNTVIKSLRDYGVRLIVISTNGLLIDGRKAKKLSRLDIDFIAISLHGRKKLHNNLVGYDVYDKIVEAIRVCHEEGLKVCIKTLITRQNTGETTWLSEFIIRNDLEAWYICDLVPRGYAKTENKTCNEVWEKIIRQLVDLVRAHDILVDVGAHPSTQPYICRLLGLDPSRVRSKGCPAGHGFIAVAPDGTITPCNFVLDYKIAKITRSMKPSALLETLEAGLHEMEREMNSAVNMCTECPYSKLCGGCRAKAYYMKGSISAEDPTCLLRRRE